MGIRARAGDAPALQRRAGAQKGGARWRQENSGRRSGKWATLLPPVMRPGARAARAPGPPLPAACDLPAQRAHTLCGRSGWRTPAEAVQRARCSKPPPPVLFLSAARGLFHAQRSELPGAGGQPVAQGAPAARQRDTQGGGPPAPPPPSSCALLPAPRAAAAARWRWRRRRRCCRAARCRRRQQRQRPQHPGRARRCCPRRRLWAPGTGSRSSCSPRGGTAPCAPRRTRRPPPRTTAPRRRSSSSTPAPPGSRRPPGSSGRPRPPWRQ